MEFGMTVWPLGALLSAAGIGYLLHAGLAPAGSGLAELAWLGLAIAATAAIGLLESGR
jgi:hypothetical protein